MRTGTNLPALGSETRTVSTTGVGLTRSQYDKVPPAVRAEVQVLNAPVRWWADGSTPTSSVGKLAAPFAVIPLIGPELPQFRAIRQGGTDGVLQVQYQGAG